MTGEKHEIKKSSYYVWFLGAKESRGLRGEEFISPVVKYLMGKEREQPPIKVTLQLSNKGLKIIQNMSGKRLQDTYRVSRKYFDKMKKIFLFFVEIFCEN